MQITIEDTTPLLELPMKIRKKVVAACLLCAGAGIALMSIFMKFI
jgi:hypothetical protein